MVSKDEFLQNKTKTSNTKDKFYTMMYFLNGKTDKRNSFKS